MEDEKKYKNGNVSLYAPIDLPLEEIDALIDEALSSNRFRFIYIIKRTVISPTRIIYKILGGSSYDVGEIRLFTLEKNTIFSYPQLEMSEFPSFLLAHPEIKTFTLPTTIGDFIYKVKEEDGKIVLQVSGPGWDYQLEQHNYFIEKLLQEVTNIGQKIGVSKKINPRGPNDDTLENYLIFKKIKDTNPDFTYEDVAQEASISEGRSYKAEDVRNAYRSMEVKWKKGKKSQ